MVTKWILTVAAVLAVGFPAGGFAAAPVEADKHSLLSAFVAYTDLRIASIQQSLDILSSTAEAKSANWETMKALLTGYEQSNGGSLIVWFVLPDGTYYTVDKGLIDVKLSDRGYFPGLMLGRKVAGDVVISKSTGRPSAVIAVPVLDGGKVVGAIGVSLFLDGLSAQVGSTLELRSDAGFVALDPNGQITLHPMTAHIFLSPRELESEAFKKAAREMQTNGSGETRYVVDNVTKRVIYRTSPLTHWKHAIVVNRARRK